MLTPNSWSESKETLTNSLPNNTQCGIIQLLTRLMILSKFLQLEMLNTPRLSKFAKKLFRLHVKMLVAVPSLLVLSVLLKMDSYLSIESVATMESISSRTTNLSKLRKRLKITKIRRKFGTIIGSLSVILLNQVKKMKNSLIMLPLLPLLEEILISSCLLWMDVNLAPMTSICHLKRREPTSSIFIKIQRFGAKRVGKRDMELPLLLELEQQVTWHIPW